MVFGFGKPKKDIIAINEGALSPAEVKFFRTLSALTHEFFATDPACTEQEKVSSCYSRFKSTANAYLTMLQHTLPDAGLGVKTALQTMHGVCEGYEAGQLVRKEMMAYAQGQKFDALSGLEALIAKSPVNEESKKYCRQYLNDQWLKISHNQQIWDRFEKTDMFREWAGGQFSPGKPLFTSEAELQVFGKQLAVQVGNLLRVKAPLLSSAIPNEVAARFMARAITHDKAFWDAEKARAEKKAARDAEEREQYIAAKRADQERALQNEAEAARKRTEAKIAAHDLFMQTRQPYVLQGVDTEAANRFALLVSLAHSTAQSSKNARALVDACHDVAASLDTRYPGVRELGLLVLSPGNIVSAAHAYDTANPFPGTHAPTPAELGVSAAKLHNSYLTSTAARYAIEKMMQHDEQILLVATLTCTPERCKAYRASIQQAQRQLAPDRATIAGLETALAGFTPEERSQLTDDVKALEEARKALAVKKTETGLDALRLALAGEIRHTLAGASRKPAASTDSKHSMPVFEPANGAVVLPEALDTILKTFPELQVRASAMGDKFATIYRNDAPDMQVEIKRNTNALDFATELHAFLARSGQGLLKEELLAQLDDRHGFEIHTRQGKQFLEHEAYGISVSLEPTAKLTGDLYAAKMRFEERQFQQMATLEMAREVGVGIQGVDAHLHGEGVITLTHPAISGKVMKVAQNGFLGDDAFAAIQGLINRLQPKRALPLPAPAHAEDEKGEKPWKLPLGHRLMIFDTGPLRKLTAPRRHAEVEHDGKAQATARRTWLDMVEQTAALPNVTVVIPAVIANLELQGKVPVSDAEHHRDQLQSVDPRFRKGSGHFLEQSAEPLARLLKTASHARIIEGAEGKQLVLEKRGNPKIVIMETDEDKLVYRKARKVLRLAESERVAALRAEVYGRGEGELAINRILKELPVAAVVVSDDTKYFNTAAPASTGQGMPVAQTGTGCYLKAEIRARGQELGLLLDESQPVSLFRIGNEVNAFWAPLQHEDYIYLNNHNRAGATTAAHGPKPEEVYDVIQHGWQEQLAVSPKPAAGDPAGKWAKNGKCTGPIGRSLITPAQVHERQDDVARGAG